MYSASFRVLGNNYGFNHVELQIIVTFHVIRNLKDIVWFLTQPNIMLGWNKKC